MNPYRYLVFAGPHQYDRQGAHDLVATAPTLDEAMALGVKAYDEDPQTTWWHVYDLHSDVIFPGVNAF